ncbi:uncharacterized protein LOC143018433 [Oratosquilla oratoria]|uniref:uncharacterized protein LOC143018433 n=1 Tax=Oratosquilla oratoria TaxID=337810 RepID=UPI003F758683
MDNANTITHQKQQELNQRPPANIDDYPTVTLGFSSEEDNESKTTITTFAETSISGIDDTAESIELDESVIEPECNINLFETRGFGHYKYTSEPTSRLVEESGVQQTLRTTVCPNQTQMNPQPNGSTDSNPEPPEKPPHPTQDDSNNHNQDKEPGQNPGEFMTNYQNGDLFHQQTDFVWHLVNPALQPYVSKDADLGLSRQFFKLAAYHFQPVPQLEVLRHHQMIQVRQQDLAELQNHPFFTDQIALERTIKQHQFHRLQVFVKRFFFENFVITGNTKIATPKRFLYDIFVQWNKTHQYFEGLPSKETFGKAARKIIYGPGRRIGNLGIQEYSYSGIECLPNSEYYDSWLENRHVALVRYRSRVAPKYSRVDASHIWMVVHYEYAKGENGKEYTVCKQTVYRHYVEWAKRVLPPFLIVNNLKMGHVVHRVYPQVRDARPGSHKTQRYSYKNIRLRTGGPIADPQFVIQGLKSTGWQINRDQEKEIIYAMSKVKFD